MASESGFSTQVKYGEAQHKTIHNLGSQRYGTSVSTKALSEISAVPMALTGVAVDPKDPKVLFLELAGHNTRKGDILRFMSGSAVDYELEVIEVVDSSIIRILNIGGIQVGDTVKPMRWVTSKADREGNLNFSPGPNTFIKDGSNVVVTEDSADSSNNKGLPSLAMIYKNGVQVPVADSDSDPNDVVAVPVKITDVGGANINITAGDINVKTSDMGVNFDSQRIGDGSGNYVKVEADGSINANVDTLAIETKLDSVITQVTAINAKNVALETTQLDVKTAVESIALEDFATETTLAAMSVKLDGLATEAKQDDLILAINGITFDKTGLATSAKQDDALLKLTEIDLVLDNSKLVLDAMDIKLGTANTKLTEMDNAVDAMSAKLPASLGAKTGANSLSIVPASDAGMATSALQTTGNNTLSIILSGVSELVAQAGAALMEVSTETVTPSVAVTFTPPSGAKRMAIINNAGTNADSIRWVAGAQTPTANFGALLVPSAQSPLYPAGEIKVIARESNADVSVAWFG